MVRRTVQGKVITQEQWDECSEDIRAYLCYSSRTEKGILEGIACFGSLVDALSHAEGEIARFTRSNFPEAWFYERVKKEILKQIEGGKIN
jgi:hypothetical protein